MSRSRLPVFVEVLTGISIVVSLVLVAMEVRANTKAIERQIRVDRAQAMALPVLESAPLREAYGIIKNRDGWEPEVSAFMEAYGLSPEQAIAWTRFLHRMWLETEADFEYMGPDPELLISVVGSLTFPDNRLFWEAAADAFTPEFRAFVGEAWALVPPGQPEGGSGG